MQESKECQIAQVAKNIQEKKQADKELISYRNDEKIRLKNHDQLLKKKEKKEKQKERMNRFRHVGERMGGTGVPSFSSIRAAQLAAF